MTFEIYAGIRSLGAMRRVDVLRNATTSEALAYANLCAYRLYKEAEKQKLVITWHDCACAIFDSDCMGYIEWELMGIDPNDDSQVEDVNRLYMETLENDLCYDVKVMYDGC